MAPELNNGDRNPMTTQSILDRILDLARWAPSGDNTQPWRFERLGAMSVRVHGFDTRSHCVYDLDGHPSQLSIGALLETISIAASAHRWAMTVRRDRDAAEDKPRFDIEFNEDLALPPSPLAATIDKRSVQRRAFKTRPLRAEEKAALSQSVGPDYKIVWLESAGDRLRTAKMLFHSAKLRLTIPEAYRVHRDVIEWHAQFSKDRIPDQALGANPMTVVLMRHVMKSWERVHFFNRFLAGTWAARIELDLVPGFACAAHFLLQPAQAPRSSDDYVAAGRALQRFWLTATLLNLQLQPEITPLVFARYAREGRTFSEQPWAADKADQVRLQLERLVGIDGAVRTVFMGRIGESKAAAARSIRHDLAELNQSTSPVAQLTR